MKRFATSIAVGSVLLVAGFAVGYVLSSNWGRELMRREVEQVLSDVLQGEVAVAEVRVVLSRGLGLHASDLRAYPSRHGPELQADEAYIELNEAALLLGRFELALLILDEAVFRPGIGPDGSWTFAPLQSARNRAAMTDETQAEAVLGLLAGAEWVARELLEKPRIAEKIVVNRGTIRFDDPGATTGVQAGTEVQPFSLQHIDGMLTRPWLSDDGQLALTATLTDPSGNEAPVRWTAFVRNGELEVTAAAADLDLAAVDTYVNWISDTAELAGRLSGEVRLQAAEAGYQHAVVDVALQEVAASVALGEERLRVELPMQTLQARLEIEPEVARLIDARASGRHVGLEAFATVIRPISSISPARIEAQLGGLAVDDIGPIASQLPGSGSAAFRKWFGRLESGTVERLSISGSSTLETWERLLGGDLAALPPRFLVGLRVSDVALRLDEDDRLTDASFEAGWAGDRLEVQRGRGDWKGLPIPEISLTIDGLSRFVGMQASAYETDAEPLPGLPLAWEMLLEGPDDRATGGASSDRFQVEIDYIDHPVMGWPIQNARVTVQSIPHGTEFVLTHGTWGGFPIIAEAVYLLHPEPALTLGLQAGLAGAPVVANTRPAQSAVAGAAWGRGRFRLEPGSVEPQNPSILSDTNGGFELTGSTIRLSEVEVALVQSARIAAQLSIDLGEPDRLPIDFEGRIADADANDLAVVVGLPDGFISGTMDIDADIGGSLLRGQNLFAGLRGRIHGEAHDGEIQKSVPLAVAMATATDGFNPFAKRDRVQYDTVETDIVLDRGRLTAEKIELEGPVRIYASGTLDFAEPSQEIDAVVGVFLFRRVRELLGKVPLVNLILPGSNKGLVGAYFRVHGPWSEPEVKSMALKSLTEGVPDIITKPFEILQSLLQSDTKKKNKQGKEKPGKADPS
ncbi:MAG: AsmA-like C-terminal domain-containing protein [Myxococcota bacterium]|nr:AsmA-like C-terminal domain-containing protein [Myxococcota bacterium]